MITSNGPEEILAALKEHQKRTGASLRSMAADAGLSSNGLVRLNDKSWRPRADTLTKLQRWLETGESVETVQDIPLAGPGYEIVHESDGWHVIKDGIVRGPFGHVRDAASAAHEKTRRRNSSRTKARRAESAVA